MGNALDIMQLASDGAAVLVAEMAKSGWESFRTAVANFFGLGGEESAVDELRLVDAAHTRLAESPEDMRDSMAETLQQELYIQLAAFLQKNSDAAAKLQALVDSSPSGEEVRDGGASVHHNTNSQVVVSGGSISTGGSIVYRAPGGNK
ncbi:hypothetical protein [Streptomyces sp. ID05-18]|uniref:hypothetical protein n=1 Tax=Streptomyces sp. ID05-18 TaxID=3028662 RepID=UPI0029A4E560|nr:hypothetical protein [Streptomyces sp. ID05-18]MDX3486616.1 hypothetical protein [Streptomyces sp. ID05-18]